MYLISSFLESLHWFISFFLDTAHDDDIFLNLQPLSLSTSHALIIRPEAHQRPYAFAHRFAFLKSCIDPIRLALFKHHINHHPNAAYYRLTWIQAKQWWQELYGDTVEDPCDHSDDLSYQEAQQWYERSILPHYQSTQTPQVQSAIAFIKHWKMILDETPTQNNRRAHHLALRKILTSTHPDRGGCTQSTQLLLAWKNYAPLLLHAPRHGHPISTTSHCLRFSTKAKPWHVMSLFSQHLTQIEIQKHKNYYQKNKYYLDTLFLNRERIHQQAQEIKKLKHLLCSHTELAPSSPMKHAENGLIS